MALKLSQSFKIKFSSLVFNVNFRYGHNVAVLDDSFLVLGGDKGDDYSEKCDLADGGDVILCDKVEPKLRFYMYEFDLHYVPSNFCKP